MSRKHVFRILPVVTVASGIFFGFGLAHAGDIDLLVEKADDLIEHADASIEASDGIVESLDAIVEEVDAMVEDAIVDSGDYFAIPPDPVSGQFTDEAMMHADELTEAADGIAEANIALLQEVYDLLLDSDAKVDAALELFDGSEKGVAKRASKALDSADLLLKAALETVCNTFVDDAEPPCQTPTFDIFDSLGDCPVAYPIDGYVFMGAIEEAKVADLFIECADTAIEVWVDGTKTLAVLEAADDAIEAADAAVEASDAAIEAADAAIEAADKAVEKADRLVEAARL